MLGTRSWPTSYRGPLAIHPAKAFPGWACELCLTSPFFEALTEGRGAVQALRLPRGKVVAVAELVDVGRISSPESLGYVLGANEVTLATTPGAGTPGSLDNVRPLPEPIPGRGAQSLWWWDAPAELAPAGGGVR